MHRGVRMEEMKYVTILIFCIFAAAVSFTEANPTSTSTNAEKKRFFPFFPFPTFHGIGASNRNDDDDDSDDDDDDDDSNRFYSYPRDICPRESLLPTESRCRRGSVKDKDKDCATQDCIFYPTRGFTVRPSYFDIFNIPPYYRYMFSKEIGNPNPYGSYGGFGMQQSFMPPSSINPFQQPTATNPFYQSPAVNPLFPQQPNFQQQQFVPYGQSQDPNFHQQQFGPYGQGQQQFPDQQFQQFPGHNPNPYPFNQHAVPPSGFSAYPQTGQQNFFPQTPTSNFGFQQSFPPQNNFPSPGFLGMAPPAPPPPPPPPQPTDSNSAQDSSRDKMRSLLLTLAGSNPGYLNSPNPQQQFGGGANPFGATGFPFQQNPFNGGFGGMPPTYNTMGPIVAKLCRTPGKVCQCGTEEECECDAKRPKVCSQQYVDDARFFWVYEWVKHTPAKQATHNPHQPSPHQHNPHQQSPHQPNPHQPNQHQLNQHNVPAAHDSGFQQPMLKSGHPTTEQQSYNPYAQTGQADYSQPVQPAQPVQTIQPTGSYQWRRRFLYFQRPSGCKCQVARPGQSPSFGFFT